MPDTRCGRPAAYRYTWPGRPESFICQEESEKLRRVADAIGMPLQLISVHESEHAGETCRQMRSL